MQMMWICMQLVMVVKKSIMEIKVQHENLNCFFHQVCFVCFLFWIFSFSFEKLNLTKHKSIGDQTQGLGPEWIETSEQNSNKIQVGVNLFNAGAFSVARGTLVVFEAKPNQRIKPVILPFILKANGEKQLLGEFWRVGQQTQNSYL